MTNDDLRKLAKEKINLGKTRQQTLEELIVETNKSEIEIAKLVRFIPTLEAREKFKAANTLLGIILIILTFLNVFSAFTWYPKFEWLPLIFPIISVFLVIGVFKFSGSIYQTISFFSIMISINGFHKSDNYNQVVLIINFLIAAILIVLSAYLRSKLVSNYEKKKEWVTNNEGKSVMVDKVYFNEAA